MGSVDDRQGDASPFGNARRLQFGGHSAGAEAGGRCACCHGDDFRRHTFHLRQEGGIRFAGVAIEQAIDIGQQHDGIGTCCLGDAGSEPVVIAEPDFFRGDAVVFVDDGDGPCIEQAGEGSRSV